MAQQPQARPLVSGLMGFTGGEQNSDTKARQLGNKVEVQETDDDDDDDNGDGDGNGDGDDESHQQKPKGSFFAQTNQRKRFFFSGQNNAGLCGTNWDILFRTFTPSRILSKPPRAGIVFCGLKLQIHWAQQN